MLLTSTDYWVDPVDARGQTAFGVPIKIFTKPEIEDMLDRAGRYGLVSEGGLDLTCGEKVVIWDPYDLRYTFLCFVLVKRTEADG